MNKFSSATPCFSGQCGLCVNCCGGIDRVSNDHNDRRAKELAIMMGKLQVEEFRNFYNTKLNSWSKNKGYRDPFDKGWAHDSIKKNHMEMVHKYTIPTDKHNLICDNLYCKMLYHSANEWDQKKKFPNYPIYKNHEKNLSLCSICIDKD